MDKMLGLMDVSVDGTTLLSGDDSTLEPGGYSRPVQKGNNYIGYKEELMESKAEVNVAIDANFSLDTFRNLTAATLTFTADTGQVWTVAGAWVAEPPSVNQKDGKAKVTFNGPAATEILA